MNRLKNLPWTPILLFLLVLVELANLIETKKLEKLVDYSASQSQAGNSLTNDWLTDIRNGIEKQNEILERMARTEDCIENHYQAGCTIPIH
jgi:hypothetical protein